VEDCSFPIHADMAYCQWSERGNKYIVEKVYIPISDDFVHISTTQDNEVKKKEDSKKTP